MNITPLIIYLWQLADKLSGVFCALSVVCGIATGITVLICCMEECNLPWKWMIFCVTSFLLSLGGYVFTPESKTIAMMVVIPKIAESKMMQQDLPDIYNAAVNALKDQLQKK